MGDGEFLKSLHRENLKSVADPNLELLTKAVHHNRIDMLRLLLDLGLDPDERKRVGGLEELAEMMADKLGISAAEFRGKWEQEIPMRRLGQPREFAALAAFLVSERASYITGTSVQIDGGWIRSLL